jgi:hypothetical protein
MARLEDRADSPALAQVQMSEAYALARHKVLSQMKNAD